MKDEFKEKHKEEIEEINNQFEELMKDDEIKEILLYLKKKENTRNIKCITLEETKQLLDYITALQEENETLKNDKKKAVEYGKNCLENIKDQDQYMCESIDIVSLLQMIHQNYLDILQGDGINESN